MNKAIFLDRDGIINRERGFTFRLQDFEILPGVIEALQRFQERGYLLIVVSNQSGVAKELYTQPDVEILHRYMIQTFKDNNISLSEVYYCIHHPDTGNCLCRKPDSLFVEKAIARFHIEPSKSYFIGDKERDVLAGEKAGVKGILVESNTPLKEIMNLIV